MYEDHEQMEEDVREQMHACVLACWDCRHTCQKIFFNYCLKMGGQHVEEDHIKLMMDCIEICQVTADFITRSSTIFLPICDSCADVCEACAESCEDIDDDEMRHCAERCKNAAIQCREMCSMLGRVH